MDHVPGGFKRFFAVIRVLSGHALTPGGDPVKFKFNQQHTTLGSPAEAGFKEVHERHVQLVHRNRFYVHDDAVSRSISEPNSNRSSGCASRKLPLPSWSRL